MTGKFAQVTKDVGDLLTEISDATTNFESTVGYRCRSGCGHCCLNPTVEAQVVEMLPLAQHLIDTGKAEELFDRLAANDGGSCILYSRSKESDDLGRCSKYAYRPSVCRLFGFSAVKKKSGPPELATCQWQKKLYPEEVAAAQRQISSGGSVPVMSEFTFRMQNLAPSAALGFPMPINKAIKIALEKLLLERQYQI